MFSVFSAFFAVQLLFRDSFSDIPESFDHSGIYCTVGIFSSFQNNGFYITDKHGFRLIYFSIFNFIFNIIFHFINNTKHKNNKNPEA